MMNNNERALYKELCSFLTADPDRLSYLIKKAATPAVLGKLHYNRMQGVALQTIKRYAPNAPINREFKNSLKLVSKINRMKNDDLYKVLDELRKALDGKEEKYAALKGALLCGMYPEGCRTSNDVDLLVRQKDLTEIGDCLRQCGFRQGKVTENGFVPADRKEIINSRINRGETIPYIKEINGKAETFAEVDLNFSLDYKNGGDKLTDSILNRSYDKKVGQSIVRTLSNEDFLVHLCCHLYKEAATLPWIGMRRDMTMYKYCDIYFLLHGMDTEGVDAFFSRSHSLGVDRACAYAVLSADALFINVNRYAVLRARELMKGDDLTMVRVTAPAEKKEYEYTTSDIAERFFSADRTKLLREVTEK